MQNATDPTTEKSTRLPLHTRLGRLAWAGAAVLVLGLAQPAATRAQSIGVSFIPGAGALAATDSAGAPGFAQTNFNNSFGDTGVTYNDNAGLATTAMLTSSSIHNTALFADSPAGPDETLNGTFATTTGAITLTLSNIPYAAYSLVVYDLAATGATQSVTAGGVSFFTLSPNPNSAGYVDQNPATAFTYTQGTSLLAAAPTANADYVVFPLLTGSTLTFSVANSDPTAASYLDGFQIIDNPAAAPEPSTWALLAVGAVGLSAAALRRRHSAVLPD